MFADWVCAGKTEQDNSFVQDFSNENFPEYSASKSINKASTIRRYKSRALASLFLKIFLESPDFIIRFVLNSELLFIMQVKISS